MKLSSVIFSEGKDDTFLIKLGGQLAAKNPELEFNIAFPGTKHARLDVRGSQQDLADFGFKNHGKKFGDYEVFHVDDDDRGEIVRIVKR